MQVPARHLHDLTSGEARLSDRLQVGAGGQLVDADEGEQQRLLEVPAVVA